MGRESITGGRGADRESRFVEARVKLKKEATEKLEEGFKKNRRKKPPRPVTKLSQKQFRAIHRLTQGRVMPKGKGE